MTRQPKTAARKINRDQVRRSVASSSAIETGEPSVLIEARLKSNTRRFPNLTLAN